MMTMPITKNAVVPQGKIVRRLDDFPELMQALRGGDLLTGRMVCAQLFDFHRSARFAVACASEDRLKMTVKTHIKAGARLA